MKEIVIECNPKEFKKKLAIIENQEKIISISAEPTIYKYIIELEDNEDNEEWRDIPGRFYGIYQISSRGRIRSVKIRLIKHAGKQAQLTDRSGKASTVSVDKIYKEVFE